jgi:hypothetical protein
MLNSNPACFGAQIFTSRLPMRRRCFSKAETLEGSADFMHTLFSIVLNPGINPLQFCRQIGDSRLVGYLVVCMYASKLITYAKQN